MRFLPLTTNNTYNAAVNPATDRFPDALNQVTYPSAGGYNDSTSSNYTPDLTYKYHRHGGLKSVQEGSVTTRTFTFDSNFELTQENLGAFNNNQTLNYTYDTTTTGFKGRLSAFNFVNDNAYKNSYTYDATSRLDQVTANHYSSTAFDYTYHAEVNVVDYLQHGNYKIDPVYRSDSYRLDKVIHNWGSGTSKQQETRFTYDNLGRRIEEKTRGYFTTYQGYSSNGHVTDTDYNDRNEVDYSARFLMNSSWGILTTQVTGSYHEWTYDAMGNRLTRKVEQPTGTTVTENYQTNELNQYTSDPENFGLTLTFDDNGNITSDQIYNYTYDAENRVTRIVEVWGWGQIDFKYDYLGRRTQKKADKLVNGLRGHYNNNNNFTGFSHQQTDSQINFNWGTGGASGLNPDTFSIRWTGYLQAPNTGNYTLTLNKNDGARMWLDGQQIINAWTTNPASASKVVHLKKGVRHHIVIDFREDTGTAHVNLQWSGPGVTGTQVVPSANLWSHSITETEETRYIYQGWNLIAETDGSHVIQRKFTWGLDVSGTAQGAGGVGGLLMIQDGTDEYFPIYDGSGNITGLYDENGNVDAAYEYDPYGRIVKQSGPYADKNPFRFSTKYTDAEMNLVYYGFRYYSPRMGRFLNRDPIGEAGGLNLYGFVGNNPVNIYDYLGLTCEDGDEDEDEYCEFNPWHELFGYDSIDEFLVDYGTHREAVAATARIEAGLNGVPYTPYSGAIPGYWAQPNEGDSLFGLSLGIGKAADGLESALGNALRKVPYFGGLLGAIGDTISGVVNTAFGLGTFGISGTLGRGLSQLEGGISSIVEITFKDAYATVVGLGIGTLASVAQSVGDAFGNLISGNVRGIGENLAVMVADLPIPKYGWWNGLNWGKPQFGTESHPTPINQGDFAGYDHDKYLKDFLWIDRYQFPLTGHTPNGIFGGLYGILGTVPFTIFNRNPEED